MAIRACSSSCRFMLGSPSQQSIPKADIFPDSSPLIRARVSVTGPRAALRISGLRLRFEMKLLSMR